MKETRMANPFKIGTKPYEDFETLSDLQWHCTKCELKSGQAKTWQVWRQEKGIQLDQDEKGHWYKTLYCEHCGENTVHRKLKSLELVEVNKARSGIPSKVAKKVKLLYDNEEAVMLRKLSDSELEVDHKFPQIRWGANECDNTTLSDEELKSKFMLLNRSNNLLKSRYCERCFADGKRGSFPGVKYWYRGNENWQGKDNFDENGCVGCFWYDPYEWRKQLNEIVKNKEDA